MSRLSVRREDAAQIFGEESAARRAQGLLLALHLAGQRTLHLLTPLYTVHCTLYTVHNITVQVRARETWTSPR